MIEAKDLSRIYHHGNSAVHAVSGVSFKILPGSIVALLGKSGSGKTSLLNLLAGLDHATSGYLKVNDSVLTQSTAGQLDRYRQESVGIVFQQFRLVRHRTAAQNIELPLILSGCKIEERKEKVHAALGRVGLLERANHFPTELSGGEQQRIAIARAIVHRPPILLADEPTGNLDSGNTARIMGLLEDLHQERQSTLIMVTHDERLANKLTDQIIRMQDGQIVENGLNPCKNP